MIEGWVTRCGLRSIDMRSHGFIPPSRLFNAEKSPRWHTHDSSIAVTAKILPHWFEITSSDALKENTKRFVEETDNTSWTCYIIDRKKKPTVLFAFAEAGAAVRAKLILGN